MAISGGAMPMAARNHFSLFNLPVRFALDLNALETAWRAVQGAVHPDRFAFGTDAQRLLALQYSTQINEAHQTLKDPVRRATYLCHLNGVEIDAERNTSMPKDFLLQQMQWRELLDDAVAARDLRALSHLDQEVNNAIAEGELLIGHLLDRTEPDTLRAAEEVRRMMFLTRFRSQVSDELRRCGHGPVADC